MPINMQSELNRFMLICLMLLSICTFMSVGVPANAQEANTKAFPETPSYDQETNEHRRSDKSRTETVYENAEDQGVPLIIAGEEVFRVRAKLGPYTPARRVESIIQTVTKLEEDAQAIQQITTRETPFSTDIVSGSLTILTVTDQDCRLSGSQNRQKLAAEMANKLRTAVQRNAHEHSFKYILTASILTLAATLVLVVLLCAIGWLFPRMYKALANSKGKFIRAIKIQKTELLSQDTLSDMLVGLLRILRILIVLSLLSIYAPVVLSFFPDTRHLSGQIVSHAAQPVRDILLPSAISYLPNIAFITAACIANYYLLAFTHFVFNEIGRRNIVITGFDPEWSESTYKIARFLIIAFMFVMIYPYLPGSGSPAFQQVSIFLGILLSLGSTGSVSHIIAGVFLTYTGAFKIGDRVKIADTIGDVTEKTLLATRIRTIKHEYITIPNGLVLGSHIINYSSSAGNPGLILHTTITIGYDAPWQKVHKLLVEAALATEGILKEPNPFVLQTSLDDYYVSYQINACTDRPSEMAVTYSKLHQNIQDAFNQAGVEIMSPHYRTIRDGNMTTIPEEYHSKDYSPPTFGVCLHRRDLPVHTLEGESNTPG